MITREEFERRRSLLRVGAWYSQCCYLDLYRIETEQEAQQMRDDFDQYVIYDEMDLAPMVWTTEREALEHFRNDLEEYRPQIEERLRALR